MEVFISWSGDTSKALAEVLRRWLPGVIQTVKPYYSPDDIAKGSRWSAEIAQELDASRIGLLCITRENLSAPWILFEAGALSKNLGQSRVCPILFGIDPSNIQGPLVQFQAAQFDKAEMKRVVTMINSECGDAALEPDVLSDVFEMWWPQLAKAVEQELNKASESGSAAIRSERDLLEEILETTRALAKVSFRGTVAPPALEALTEAYLETVEISMRINARDLISAVYAMYEPLKHIVGYLEEGMPPETKLSLLSRLKDPALENALRARRTEPHGR
jgi:hypothetical protein